MKYFLLLLFPFIIACEDSITADVNKVSSIQYSFHDSSVAPEYHRSYDITVTPADVHVIVDSYGDKLADETYEVAAEQFNELIEIINAAELISGSLESEPGCTGGTSETLIINEVSQQVYKASIDNCGGTTIPTEMGDFKNVINTINSLIPNLAELRK
jgi:hypothetical protein